MMIQVDGTNRLNKGAELMLRAVLDEIEKSLPHATVVINERHTGVDFYSMKEAVRVTKPFRLRWGHYPWFVLSALGLPYRRFTEFHPQKGIDVILDASGFRFGDQWNPSRTDLDDMQYYYRSMKQCGSRLVFLPQAFGPFTRDSALRTAELLNRYADLIFARDRLSAEYLLQAGLDADKVRQAPDFTLAVRGRSHPAVQQMCNAVGIIPNRKMLSHTALGREAYAERLQSCIMHLHKKGWKVYLLNHEGPRDMRICRMVQKKLPFHIPVFNGLDAREIKGIIAASALILSSRYHGVASALNQGVPCLATSWSHKYEQLFEDFTIEPQILNLQEPLSTMLEKMDSLLHEDKQQRLRKRLAGRLPALNEKVSRMWSEVWNACPVSGTSNLPDL